MIFFDHNTFYDAFCTSKSFVDKTAEMNASTDNFNGYSHALMAKFRGCSNYAEW